VTEPAPTDEGVQPEETAPCGCVSFITVRYVNGMNVYEAFRTMISSCDEHA